MRGNRSNFRWKTAIEYEEEDLASDSDDEKRIQRSERKVEGKSKSASRKFGLNLPRAVPCFKISIFPHSITLFYILQRIYCTLSRSEAQQMIHKAILAVVLSFLVLSRSGFNRSLLITLLAEVHVFFWKALAGSLLKCYQSFVIFIKQLTFWDYRYILDTN